MDLIKVKDLLDDSKRFTPPLEPASVSSLFWGKYPQNKHILADNFCRAASPCHEHIAQLFQQKQIEPLWLPGHRVAYDIMKPESETTISGDAPGVEGAGVVSDSDELLDDTWDQPTSSDSVA